MTKETKAAAKAEIYKGYREKAVGMLSGLVPDVTDDCAGVSNAVGKILEKADRPEERSRAVLAGAMWMHGYLEEDTAARLAKLAEVVAGEIEAAGTSAK